MTDGLNFIAIDFETATGKRASICEVGICVVRNGEIIETHSWLVRPEDNLYSYWNMKCHGITPEDTENSPSFPEVWEEIERLYLDEFDTLVAHNAPFDRSCLEHSARLYNLHLPELQWQCTLKIARQVYDLTLAATHSVIFASNSAFRKVPTTVPVTMPRCVQGCI